MEKHKDLDIKVIQNEIKAAEDTAIVYAQIQQLTDSVLAWHIYCYGNLWNFSREETLAEWDGDPRFKIFTRRFDEKKRENNDIEIEWRLTHERWK